MKTPQVRNNVISFFLIFTIVVLSGCVSASRMLDRAESAWTAGQYSAAIDYALASYEKAVEKNKEPGDIADARAFLEERFPMANDYLLEQAQRQLEGSDNDKSNAWKTFETLVRMNRRVRDSIASSFLITEDYNDQLQKAKETAAQIKYVKALELIGEDRRDSYIAAFYLLKEIDSFVPDYRDVRSLSDQCREAATLVVAVSTRDLPLTVKKGTGESHPDLASLAMGEVENFIVASDNGEFLDFIGAGSAQGAKDSGAVLFLEIQGDAWISSETLDEYASRGEITWMRSYGGSPTLVVTRLNDGKTEVATASLSLDQEISIEFFPEKYNTQALTQDMYSGQFNNASWMSSQLSSAKSVLSKSDSRADMVVWAEMQYGGISEFLTFAQVDGAEGVQEMPIDPAVWSATADFINKTLDKFLAFTDINVSSRMVDEMASSFLSNAAVKDLLSDLE